MGGRGGGSAVSRERMQADFDALMREQGQLGPEQQIQRVYQQLAQKPGDWVGLADLRERLPGLSRSQQDAALRDMLRYVPGVRIIPVANRKALKPRDWAAALDIGGELNHAFSIDRRYDYPKESR